MGLDYELERSIRIKQIDEIEHKSLYEWAIVEVDENGFQEGNDLVPWSWAQYFTATSCVLTDNVEIGHDGEKDGKQTTTEVAHRQVIRVQLKSGDPRRPDDLRSNTVYRMFGTDRDIRAFQLDIHPTSKDEESESISSWGSPQYKSDVDFRDETMEDTVVFYLRLKPEAFTRLAAKITTGSIDEIVFRVGGVKGFYSEWSPSITTSRIKVLTRGDRHDLELPEGFQRTAPQLGDVLEAELTVDRKLEFSSKTSDDADDRGTFRIDSQQHHQPSIDSQKLLKTLASIKSSARWIIAILVVIMIANVFPR